LRGKVFLGCRDLDTELLALAGVAVVDIAGDSGSAAGEFRLLLRPLGASPSSGDVRFLGDDRTRAWGEEAEARRPAAESLAAGDECVFPIELRLAFLGGGGIVDDTIVVESIIDVVETSLRRERCWERSVFTLSRL
jgi:hypothetical protein